MSGVDTSYKTLNRIHSGQIVYSRLKAFEGAITVAPLDLIEGYASQEFPTFTCGPDLLPDFFKLVTTSPRLWDDLQNLSTGMGGRRERVKPTDFLTIPISLPPVCEQRRIVDVMAAVEAEIDALEDERESARQVLSAVRSRVASSTEVHLSEVLSGIDSGKSVMTSGGAPVDGQPRILRLSAVRPGVFDADEAKLLDDTAGFSDDLLVRNGDLLVTRSNTPDRVGYCAVARDVPVATYLPDLIWRLRLRETCRSDYLEHLLAAEEVRARVTATASGTSSSMQKINKRGFSSVRIPLPSLEEQERYASTCEVPAALCGLLAAELGRFRDLRTNLLTSYLNQEIFIPESYDALLEAAS
jgi:type I restriction enzyme S subunit